MGNLTKPLQKKVNNQHQTIRDLQRASSDHSDRLVDLESTVNTLTAQVKLLTDKCEDLEGWSKRNNIHLWGTAENLEGPRLTEFVAQLLKDVLDLDEVPLLHRSHHSHRAKAKGTDPPRPFIIRVHFFHVRKEILPCANEASRTSPLLYQGKSIFISLDYTGSVAKKRAALPVWNASYTPALVSSSVCCSQLPWRLYSGRWCHTHVRWSEDCNGLCSSKY